MSRLLGCDAGEQLVQWLQKAPPECLQGVHLLGWLPYRKNRTKANRMPKILESVSRNMLQRQQDLHALLSSQLQVRQCVLLSTASLHLCVSHCRFVLDSQHQQYVLRILYSTGLHVCCMRGIA